MVYYSSQIKLRAGIGAICLLCIGLALMLVMPRDVPILGEHLADRARSANRQRWYREANPPPPTLLEIKTAAENGDAQAQQSLAEVYLTQLDYVHAMGWLKRAAEQGRSSAQLALAQILLEGRRCSPTSAAVPPDADEAVMWLGQAANQGNVQAWIKLGGCYQRGTGVEPNLTEAYKWFALARRQSNAVARVELECLQLQMSSEAIVAGQQAADHFIPSKDGSLPEPSYLSQLRVNGISMAGKKPLAIVNNRTLEESEQSSIKLNGRNLAIRCLKIEAASVLIQVGPFRKQLRLEE